MFRKIFIGSYITIFLLCILSKFLLNTDIFLIYFIVTIIMVSLLINICLILKINFICVYIVTIYKRLGYIKNNLSYTISAVRSIPCNGLKAGLLVFFKTFHGDTVTGRFFQYASEGPSHIHLSRLRCQPYSAHQY